MSILVLDWERDIVWTFGPHSIVPHLARLNCERFEANGDIYNVEFDDHIVVSIVPINDILIITHNLDVNSVLMKIKDTILTNDNAILTAAIVHQSKGLLTAAFNNNNDIESVQEGLVCQEMVSDKLVGHLYGHSNEQVCISINSCKNASIFKRPESTVEYNDNGICIQCKPHYYEQVKYTYTDCDCPVIVNCEMHNKNAYIISAKNKTDIRLENIIIKISMIKAITQKRLNPDNLNHKCVVDELGLEWTVLSLPPHQEYTVRVELPDSHRCINGINGTVSFTMQHQRPDIVMHNRPMPVMRVYDNKPWP